MRGEKSIVFAVWTKMGGKKSQEKRTSQESNKRGFFRLNALEGTRVSGASIALWQRKTRGGAEARFSVKGRT